MRYCLRSSLIAACLFASPLLAQDKEVKEGDPAPDIDLPAVNVGKVLPEKKDATTLNLKEIKGKNIV